MPSIENIVQVAEALEKCPVAVVRDRCVAVRNRNASCRACARICPVNAFTVQGNEIEVDAGACMGCGACVAACPTEAIVPLQPTEQQLSDAAVASIEANSGRAVIACARISSKRQADPRRYAEVSCLARVDEGLVVALVAKGARSVLLVDGNCATCKYRACTLAMDMAAAYADELLEVHGCDVRVERVTGFPEDMRVEDAGGLHGSTRRGFFSDALGAAKETARAAAKTTLESELGYKLDEVPIGDRLRVTDQGTLPLLSMKRHEAALNALDAIGLPESGLMETRLFASIDIDVERCNSCGMCAVFCPSGALKRSPAKKPSDPLRFLEFSAADCVQCRMCVDVCWKGALTLSSCVDAAELYDFEPRTFRLSAKKKR